MESSELDGVIPVEIDELDMLKHRLDSEFQRTIFRIISLILTCLNPFPTLRDLLSEFPQ